MAEAPADGVPTVELVSPDGADLLDETRAIFRDYAASLAVDLCFQNFEDELATLPGDYRTPGGRLLLAIVDGAVAGCGALRPLPDCDYPNACEMKRLYVRPATLPEDLPTAGDSFLPPDAGQQPAGDDSDIPF